MQDVILTILSMIGGSIAFGISTYFVVQQMRESRKQQKLEYKWNRCKASQEVLVSVITGEFPQLMDALSRRFAWDILSHEPYDAVIARVQKEDLLELDIVLRNIFRHLEVISINMKHGIIEEEMCYDYLRSILTTFYCSCVPFLDKERLSRQEPAVFIELEQYAERWLQRGGRRSPRDIDAPIALAQRPQYLGPTNQRPSPIAA
jgi:hypothetical protein